MLRTVLASLATGDTPDAILDDFPSLTPEDIQGAIAFAAHRLKRICPYQRFRESNESKA